jgi:hypothetical protein
MSYELLKYRQIFDAFTIALQASQIPENCNRKWQQNSQES